MCDHCDYFFHTDCLQIPVTGVPKGPFFCGDWCKTAAGRESKRLTKIKSTNTSKSYAGEKRKRGGSMAMAARTKVCTIVGPNHFGPIPGIHVGMCWKYRVQLVEEGVHRASVAGIAGGPKMGSPSIVLSGGYAEDRGNI